MKTTIYRVSFSNGSTMPRWRVVGDAGDDHDAIQKALQGTGEGVLKRYAARNGTLKAFVSRPGLICHENGNPMIVEGYTLKLDGRSA